MMVVWMVVKRVYSKVAMMAVMLVAKKVA